MMRRTSIRGAGAAGIAALIGCSPVGAAVGAAMPGMEPDLSEQSYSLGAVVGDDLRGTLPLESLDAKAFVAGLTDAVQGKELALETERMNQALALLEQQQREAALAEREKLAAANREEGDAYRANFAADPDVVTLESGVQYKVLVDAEGEKPAADATVTVHYTGRLLDGREFDSSRERNEPASFPIEAVIGGLGEALQVMPEGSTWQVVVPPDLAYGAQGAGRLIGPDATLVFEVELIRAG